MVSQYFANLLTACNLQPFWSWGHSIWLNISFVCWDVDGLYIICSSYSADFVGHGSLWQCCPFSRRIVYCGL